MIRVHLSRLMGEHKEKIADVMRSTGLTRNTLAGLYNESAARLDFSTLDAICLHYGCSVGELLQFVGDEADGRTVKTLASPKTRIGTERSKRRANLGVEPMPPKPATSRKTASTNKTKK